MNDEKQKPEFYWFRTQNNPYAIRIQAILEEAERHPVPPFRIADMLRELADQYNPPPPKWPKRVLLNMKYWVFGVS